MIFSGKICTHGDLGVSGGSYSGFWLARVMISGLSIIMHTTGMLQLRIEGVFLRLCPAEACDRKSVNHACILVHL
jgi:hypothetical protein